MNITNIVLIDGTRYRIGDHVFSGTITKINMWNSDLFVVLAGKKRIMIPWNSVLLYVEEEK